MNHSANGDERQFDQLLADYFDWVDESQGSDVKDFLRDSPKWRQSEMAPALAQYVRQSQEVEQLATATLSQWLGLDPDCTSDVEHQTMEACDPPLRILDYEMLDEIGRGGMGVVYRARNLSLDRVVCVKMILQGRLAEQQQIDRFVGEAQAMAALRHPNIVAVHDVGHQDDQYFFAMEYIDGKTLAELVRSGPLATEQVVGIVREVAAAIAYAHEQGVLHRDLKPSNIIVDDHGHPHVSDFGLARRLETGSLTTTGALAGTPSYMAPEQTHGGRSANVACDIYGLGAILYECITARAPFQGNTPLDTLLQVRTDDPVRPSLLNQHLSPDLETICLKCLAKSPTERYATAGEVVSELDRFSRGEPIRARPIGHLARFGRWCRRNPLPVALATTIMLAVLSVGASLLRSYVVTSTALSDLSTAHTELQSEQGRNKLLIRNLREERDHAARNLYISRLRRTSQAIGHGDTAEADELLADLVPSPRELDFRGWEWYYLRSLTKQYSRSLQHPHGPVLATIALMDDQRQWASLDSQSLRLWDRVRGEVVFTAALEDATGVIAYTRSKRMMAIASVDGEIELREAPFLETVGSLGSNRAGLQVRSLAWDHRGESIAAGYDDGSVTLWDVSSRNVIKEWAAHTDGVNSVSWSHDDTLLASAGDDSTVRVFDVSDGRSVGPLRRFQGWVNGVAFHPYENRLAAVSEDGQLRVWRIAPVSKNSHTANNTMVADELFSRASTHDESLSSVQWNTAGTQIATGGSSSTIVIWDGDAGQPRCHLHGHRGEITSLGWESDKLLVSSSTDGTVKSWDTSRGPDGDRLSATSAPVRHVAWNPRNQLIAWRDVQGLISVWDLTTRSRVAEFSESEVGATALAWHPRGDRLATAREETVLVYSIRGESEPLRLDAGDIVWTIRWSPDGRYIAVGGDRAEIQVHDAITGELLFTLKNHENNVRTFCWISGNSICSADGAAILRRWNVEEQREEAQLRIDSTLITSLSLNDQGTRVSVATQEGSIHDIDLSAMQLRMTLNGHRGPAWDSVWVSDDSRLVTAGQDGTLRIWDLVSGEEALRIHAHQAAVWSVDRSSSGNVLVSAGADGDVRFWDASPVP
jgi:WD40 repeat protein/serine/threonine protein kinase